jgi:hypothetical protein
VGVAMATHDARVALLVSSNDFIDVACLETSVPRQALHPASHHCSPTISASRSRRAPPSNTPYFAANFVSSNGQLRSRASEWRRQAADPHGSWTAEDSGNAGACGGGR